MKNRLAQEPEEAEMQIPCPRGKALADRTYDPPLLWNIKCPNCGYELEEADAREALKDR